MSHLIDLDPRTTPLFQAVSSKVVEELIEECESVMESPCFSVAQNFIQANRIDISFSPWHLVRTGWRSMKFKMKRA